jgi:16S rRNA (guanine966-N2)-methyltransferase
MSLKILGGVCKGFTVHLPTQVDFRPTSVILRRKIFDAFQNLKDWTFIDLCAGSGLMALEALSRGAKEIICLEKDHQTFTMLKKNIESFKQAYPEDKTTICHNQIKLFKGDARHYLKEFFEKKLLAPTSIFFIDPPYKDTILYQDFFNFFQHNPIQGMLWVECDDLSLSLEKIRALIGQEYRIYTHQKHYIAVYHF